jgi:hypothetical protein
MIEIVNQLIGDFIKIIIVGLAIMISITITKMFFSPKKDEDPARNQNE